MHAMQGDGHNNASRERPQSHEYMELHQVQNADVQSKKKSLKLVAVAVVGMLLPLFTQVGHVH